jgi:hypothetical protein
MKTPRLISASAGVALACLAGFAPAAAQQLSALRIYPNLNSNIDHPLRYRPDGADFVIENGPEFFNRSLYGGNTAFRVDGGDKPSDAFAACYAKCVAAEAKEVVEERNAFKKEEEEVEREEAEERAEEEGLAAAP